MKETCGLQRLREEVRNVVGSAHEGDVDLEVLHHVAHEEVPTLDVFEPVVAHRVVRCVARAHVVCRQIRRAGHSAQRHC